MTAINNNLGIYEQLGLVREETKSTAPSSEVSQDEFMELLIAQLKNQDPMNPMDNNEFLAQLAQINAAGGIQELQDSFDTLAGSLQSYQALQASSLVGRSVLAPGGTAVLPEDGTVDGTITLTASTQQLQLGVYDANGQLVRRIDMGTQAAGTVSFSWDGLKDDGTEAAPGTYSIKAEALMDGAVAAMKTAVYAQVESVNLSARTGVQLNLAGIGPMGLSEVKQVK